MLALTAELSGDAAAASEAAADALHAISNLSAVSVSSSRILRRRADDDPMAEELARGLEDAAAKAEAAVTALKRDIL
ncbi:hypothetical protein [Mangrovicoccus ximenensis]|uniref:hypothetical protein n=1 Tax=Mangrovicoccus ximenensis TaxID=1911570 RepID=UPI000D3C66CA|nr:hypothetical protein [Mangrovicoccus ximenensis]